MNIIKHVKRAGALGVALCLAGCSADEWQQPEESGQDGRIEIEALASVPEKAADARLVFDETATKLQFLWSEGDVFNVTRYGSDWTGQMPVQMYYAESEPKAEGRFVGQGDTSVLQDNDSLFAIYPGYFQQNGTTVPLAITQLHGKLRTENILMAGGARYRVGETPRFTFRHLTAQVRFRLTLPDDFGTPRVIRVTRGDTGLPVEAKFYLSSGYVLPQSGTNTVVLDELEVKNGVVEAVLPLIPRYTHSSTDINRLDNTVVSVTNEEGEVCIAYAPIFTYQAGKLYNVRMQMKYPAPFDNQPSADGYSVPYEISTFEQLYAMALITNAKNNIYSRSVMAGENRYRLMADITMDENTPWVPIGEMSDFSDELDGNGHTIRGTVTMRPGPVRFGLFGGVSGTIKNLTIDLQFEFPDAGDEGGIVCGRVGALVADAVRAKIENCHNKGSLLGVPANILGGLAGCSQFSTFEACSNEAALEGSLSVGGIVGLDEMNTNLTGCFNSGRLKGHEVGGLVVWSTSGSYYKACWSLSDFDVPSDGFAGGLVGLSSGMLPMDKCYWQGDKWQPVAKGQESCTLNGCAAFDGTQPTAEQVEQLNQTWGSKQWYFDANGRTQAYEGGLLPDMGDGGEL